MSDTHATTKNGTEPRNASEYSELDYILESLSRVDGGRKQISLGLEAARRAETANTAMAANELDGALERIGNAKQFLENARKHQDDNGGAE